MNAQCPKCHFIVTLDNGRYPPWCKKCGVDLKPSDYVPVAVEPVAPAPEPPAVYSYSEPVVTTVTGTGAKGWLKGAAATAPHEGRGAERPDPREAEPPAPKPALSAEEESNFGLLKVGGVILLLVAAITGGNAWVFNKNGRETTGQVVRMNSSKLGPQYGPQTYRIQYTANGASYDQPPGPHSPGESVELVYDTRNPETVRLGTKSSQYTWPGLIAVLGVSLIAAGMARANVLRAQRHRTSPQPDF